MNTDTAASNIAVYSGRPVSEEGRLPREIQVYDFLDKLSIPYERADHPQADTIEACRDIDQALQVNMCKNFCATLRPLPFISFCFRGIRSSGPLSFRSRWAVPVYRSQTQPTWKRFSPSPQALSVFWD